MSQPGKEKRGSHRSDIRWPVSLVTDQGTIQGEIVNISLAGAFLLCEQPLASNQRFGLIIRTPDRSPVEMTGEVVRSNIPDPEGKERECKAGIRFVDVSEEKERELYKAIREEQKKQPKNSHD
jgi:c-di-GMP-binding flagellar brake protein YcgR